METKKMVKGDAAGNPHPRLPLCQGLRHEPAITFSSPQSQEEAWLRRCPWSVSRSPRCPGRNDRGHRAEGRAGPCCVEEAAAARPLVASPSAPTPPPEGKAVSLLTAPPTSVLQGHWQSR